MEESGKAAEPRRTRAISRDRKLTTTSWDFHVENPMRADVSSAGRHFPGGTSKSDRNAA